MSIDGASFARILSMQNTIQPYDWGSKTAIAELLGEPTPAPTPQAELWMGAHPRGPSRVDVGGRIVGLDELIAAHPREILGTRTAREFDGKLPFLFKVLAAARPASIQAHPDLAQARAGFARENGRGIPVDAPDRNYRDPNHKPEIIAPLSEFWALRGFRPARETAAFFRRIDHPEARPRTAGLDADPPGEALRSFFAWLLSLEPSQARSLVAAAAEAAASSRGLGDPLAERWVRELAEAYPGDAGALAPLFLQVHRWDAGEAAYLDAGTLHSYLRGTGMELMANSDNVLRGGLTSKHVDVPELLATLRFDSHSQPLAQTRRISELEYEFVTPAREFRLSVLTLTAAAPRIEKTGGAVQILFAAEGTFLATADGGEHALERGRSCLVPAALRSYRIAGAGRIYAATVPPPRGRAAG
jgi:mannose-6-phosphate isomerase